MKKSIFISHPSFYICSQLLDANGFAKMLVGSSNEVREGLVEEMQKKEEKQNVPTEE